MRKSRLFNLVLNLADTNIPTNPCKKFPCLDEHYIVVRPADYDKKTKTLKMGAQFTGFTIKPKVTKEVRAAFIEDGKRYEFKNG